MKIKINSIITCLIIILFFSYTIINPVLAKQIDTKNEKQQYLIKLIDIGDASVIRKAEGKILKKYKYNNLYVAELKESSATDLATNPYVDFVEENGIVNGAGEEISWGANLLKASSLYSRGFTGNGVKVAVLDTGIDYTNQDLLVSGGVSFVPYTTDYMDDNNHGTHIAGIIGAKHNEIGVLGISPGVELYSVKVLDRYKSGTIDQVISGIEWAIDNHMDILNLSLTTYTKSSALQLACDTAFNKGLLLVSAAGNNGGGKKDTISYPANYSSVIAVGAIDENLTRMTLSATGKNLEFIAPGSNILSLLRNGNMGYMGGTSMAAAYVTGALAVLWEANELLSNREVRELAQKSATQLGISFEYGYGLINPEGALQ